MPDYLWVIRLPVIEQVFEYKLNFGPIAFESVKQLWNDLMVQGAYEALKAMYVHEEGMSEHLSSSDHEV